MRKKAIVLLFISICMIIMAGCSSSASKDENTIIVGIDDKFAPMGFRDEKMKLSGLILITPVQLRRKWVKGNIPADRLVFQRVRAEQRPDRYDLERIHNYR